MDHTVHQIVPKHLYVSSHWRGFHYVEAANLNHGVPHTGTFPGLYLIYSATYDHLNKVWYRSHTPRYFSRESWEGSLALIGAEPWRIYKLDAEQITKALDDGNHIDDIRGFKNRLEAWQPVSEMVVTDNKIMSMTYCKPADAKIWVRTDHWCVKYNEETEFWVTDGTHCIADPETTLEYYPNHFNPIIGEAITEHAAMTLVDSIRPWE